jgi:hypothetical protein
MPSKISAEGQHLIDSLEAHLVAVKAAVSNGGDALLEHAEDAWNDVLAALEPVEAKLRAAAASQAEVTAKVAAAEPAAPPAPDENGQPATSIGDLVTANTAGSTETPRA